MPKHWDKQNVFASIAGLADQLKDGWRQAQAIVVPASYRRIERLVICGMGGSILGGRIIQSVYGQDLACPLTLVDDYRLPAWVNSTTLVICSSYSGSTEETLINCRQALKQRAKVMVIAAAGTLLTIARRHQLPVYQIIPRYNPSCQPRLAIGYSIVGQLVLCHQAGLLPFNGAEIQSISQALARVKPAAAARLARKFADKQLILVAGEHLTGAVHAVKNQLNETAKHLAHRYDLPELNHHLMEGLRFPPTNPATLLVWFFDSPGYSPRLRQRLSLTRTVVSKNQLPVATWLAAAPTKLGQALELIQFGAYVSFYLSRLHRLDPAAIPWVNYFKQQLGPLQFDY
jgi:glucose/mannose-6-phosphate isomerase